MPRVVAWPIGGFLCGGFVGEFDELTVVELSINACSSDTLAGQRKSGRTHAHCSSAKPGGDARGVAGRSALSAPGCRPLSSTPPPLAAGDPTSLFGCPGGVVVIVDDPPRQPRDRRHLRLPHDRERRNSLQEQAFRPRSACRKPVLQALADFAYEGRLKTACGTVDLDGA